MSAIPRQLREQIKRRDREWRSSKPDAAFDLTSEVERQATDIAETRGLSADQMGRAIAVADLPSLLEQASHGVEQDLRRTLPLLVRDLRAGELRIRGFLDRVWGPADRLYVALTYGCYELGAAVEQAPGDFQVDALRGLHARSCRVASEVRLLAMNGFAAGAEARWRTMHELAVVATLLSEGDAELSERYLASAIPEQWRDVCGYQDFAKRVGRAPHSQEEMSSWRKRYEVAIERYGPLLAKTNGWAAPLFPVGRKHFPFSDLEELADLKHLRPFYKLGNHHVHAGARAAELGIVNDPVTGPVRTTGATVFADIGETGHGAVISLMQSTTALLRVASGREDADIMKLAMSLPVLTRWLDEVGERFASASKRAGDLGLHDHKPGDEDAPEGQDDQSS